MAQTQQKNQTETEFFAVTATGRKGVEDMLVKMGPELTQIAAPNVRNEFDMWSKRALVWIANTDTLAPVLQTRGGLFSVYQCLTKAATMGLQLGGNFAHAYLVPRQGKATIVVTAEGFAFSAAHGPGAVLRVPPELMQVHENDTFTIDAAAGTYKHTFDPFVDRGRVVGYFMLLEYADGRRELPFVTREAVEQISNHYSQKEFGGKPAPAWSKSAEDMYRKIAAKKLLKRPAAEAEGLAMLYQADEADPVDEAAPERSRDVDERMSARLGKAAEKMGPGTVPAGFDDAVDVTPEPEPEEEVEPVGEAVEGDLF